MTMQWCRFDPVTARLTLHIHARPNAKTTSAAGLYRDALKINIAAPAVDDKANTVLIAWLAIKLELPRSTLRLKSGATARRKVIEAQPATFAAATRAAELVN